MAETNKQSEELAALKKQCEDCCKQLAALKKEVAALKKAKSSGGGSDPRIDQILSVLIELSDVAAGSAIKQKFKDIK